MLKTEPTAQETVEEQLAHVDEEGDRVGDTLGGIVDQP